MRNKWISFVRITECSVRVRKWCFSSGKTMPQLKSGIKVSIQFISTSASIVVFPQIFPHQIIIELWWECFLLTTADTRIKKKTNWFSVDDVPWWKWFEKRYVSIFSSVRSQERQVNGMHVNKLQIYKHPLWPCCALPNGNTECLCVCGSLSLSSDCQQNTLALFCSCRYIHQ